MLDTMLNDCGGGTVPFDGDLKSMPPSDKVKAEPIGSILMVTGVDEVAPRLSETSTVKTDVPITVGVPEMVPLRLSVNPGGAKVPKANENEYGATPPVTWKVKA